MLHQDYFFVQEVSRPGYDNETHARVCVRAPQLLKCVSFSRRVPLVVGNRLRSIMYASSCGLARKLPCSHTHESFAICLAAEKAQFSAQIENLKTNDGMFFLLHQSVDGSTSLTRVKGNRENIYICLDSERRALFWVLRVDDLRLILSREKFIAVIKAAFHLLYKGSQYLVPKSVSRSSTYLKHTKIIIAVYKKKFGFFGNSYDNNDFNFLIKMNFSSTAQTF